MISSDESSSSSDDDVAFIQHLNRPRKIRVYRNRIDGFTFWDDKEFYDRFRVSKRVANAILGLIRPEIQSKTDWNRAVTSAEKLLLALRFLATNNFLISMGDLAGVHKTTAGQHIFATLKAIAKLKNRFLNMPTDLEKAKIEFYQLNRFPGVIGALDCTHIKIQSPGGDTAEMYRNRKNFFSLNVQAICNARLQFIDIVSRWPGSVHDSRIFNNSRIKERFENGEFGHSILVADSGYALTPYCMVPIANPRTDRENLFNESQIRTRNVIERSFGVLKRRFPVLSLGIRLDMSKVQCIVVAAAILHNIAVGVNEVEPPPLPAWILRLIQQANDVPVEAYAGRANNNIRIQYLNYFENL